MYRIYILKCKDNKYYIGQTKRLFRRISEHFRGECTNTCRYTPLFVSAIYKTEELVKFFSYTERVNSGTIKLTNITNLLETFDDKIDDEYEFEIKYDKLTIENNITECLMINNKSNWVNYIGGKYVRGDINYTFPNNSLVKELPLCFCGLPCDIKCKNTKYLYFRCAKKNMWNTIENDFGSSFDANVKFDNKPCKFYKEYKKDIVHGRINYPTSNSTDSPNLFHKSSRTSQLATLFKKSQWLSNVPDLDTFNGDGCIGKGEEDDDGFWISGCNITGRDLRYNPVTYGGEKKPLCYECFINNNDKLYNKYDKLFECQIVE